MVRSVVSPGADGRQEIRPQLAELESRRLRLEEVRLYARRLRGPEGERLEVHAKGALKKISKQIHDIQASLK